jgi:hypothetical protein
MNNTGETKWKKRTFRKKRSHVSGDDFQIQAMNNKIRNVKNIPEFTDLYNAPITEGFMDDPEHNNNFTTIEQCLKNGDPSKCDYDGLIYPDPSANPFLNGTLIKGINGFFQSLDTINMKIAKYTYTAFSGAKTVLNKNYSVKFDTFLQRIAYYNIELAADGSKEGPNPTNNKMIDDFYNSNADKNKHGSYEKYVIKSLETDIANAITNKKNNKAFTLEYIPSDLKNSDPTDDLNLAKYIHDILLIKEYFGWFESQIVCAWCLYNLYFFIYKGENIPEFSRVKLFKAAVENYYYSILEFFLSTTMIFPQILTYIKNCMKKLLDYKDEVLPDSFLIFKNIFTNKATIMVVLFVLLLVFFATVGKFMKDCLMNIATMNIDALTKGTGIFLAICYAIALFAYLFYRTELIQSEEVGTLTVYGYFLSYQEKVAPFGAIGIVALVLLLIFHFVIHMVFSVPLGLIITLIYFLICIFSGILYFADLSAFGRIDNEVDLDIKTEIDRTNAKMLETKNKSISYIVYYFILLIIKFLYDFKHSIALIVICGAIMSDIHLHASNKAICNYIFTPALVLGIGLFLYKLSITHAKDAVVALTNHMFGIHTSNPTADNSNTTHNP